MTAPQTAAAAAAQPAGQPPEGGQGQGQGGGLGQYAGYLNGVPEQFHGQLLDGFKRTDAHWQQQLHSAQSRYQPYEQILSAHQPEELQNAVDLLSAIRADPAGALAELQAALGLDQQTGQGVPQQGTTDYDGYDGGQGFALPPEIAQRIDQQEKLLTMLAEQFIGQRQETQLNAEASALDDQLRAAYGQGYDELDDNAWDFMVGLMESGRANSPQQAVDILRQFVGQGQAQQPGATAVVMPAGGGMPSNQVDPRQLYADKKGRRELAMAIARDAQAANRQ